MEFLPIQKRYLILASRKSGDRARVKRTTSSPVTVLMSWCMVITTLMPVIFSIIASKTAISGRFKQMGPNFLQQVPSPYC